MAPTILLYDIDGTLVSTSGAGRRAMERAFSKRYGNACMLDFPFDGMTDRAIVRHGLEDTAVAVVPAALETTTDELLQLYLTALADEIGRSAVRIHDGIEASLERFVGRAGYAVGLGTGNVVEGARIKLEPVGLHGRFAFGGFGSDHIDRAKLLQKGAERGAERLGCAVSACRVVVIGDTPKDILAAQAIGADSIGVATGRYKVDDLLAYEPTAAFASLANPAALALLDG